MQESVKLLDRLIIKNEFYGVTNDKLLIKIKDGYGVVIARVVNNDILPLTDKQINYYVNTKRLKVKPLSDRNHKGVIEELRQLGLNTSAIECDIINSDSEEDTDMF
jgi:hypothetical protein